MPTTFKQQRNKGNCSIVELKGKHFLTKGAPSIYIDKAWEESVKRLDELANLLFHTCRRQETNISSPEGLFMSDSAVNAK